MIYTVHVTGMDIENGKPQDPCKCPVALAMSRTIGKRCMADTMGLFIEMRPTYKPANIRLDEFLAAELWTGRMRRLEVPASVKEFILLYDGFKSGKAQPFSFTVELLGGEKTSQTTGL